MADPLARFPEFTQAVQRRLDAGRGSYGDRSFERPPAALLDELQQEALDLAGWGYVLFERIERLKTTLNRADQFSLSTTTKVTNAP
jgi:hypothetical protein